MRIQGFLVRGMCGAYSDRSEWTVAVTTDRANADALAARLNDWCRERGVFDDNDDARRKPYSYTEKPPEDPDFRTDSTGTAYDVIDVPIDLPTCEEHTDCKAQPMLGAACLAARMAAVVNP